MFFYVKIPFENASYILHSLRDDFDGNAKTQDTCLEPNKTTFDEMNPVYSYNSGLNYLNKHCAECNGENRNAITLWPVENTLQ